MPKSNFDFGKWPWWQKLAFLYLSFKVGESMASSAGVSLKYTDEDIYKSRYKSRISALSNITQNEQANLYRVYDNLSANIPTYTRDNPSLAEQMQKVTKDPKKLIDFLTRVFNFGDKYIKVNFENVYFGESTEYPEGFFSIRYNTPKGFSQNGFLGTDTIFNMMATIYSEISVFFSGNKDNLIIPSFDDIISLYQMEMLSNNIVRL